MDKAYLEPDMTNSVEFTNPEVLAKIKRNLQQACSDSFITPHIAIARIRKVLAQYNIFFDQSHFRIPDDGGEYFFNIHQFGTEKNIRTDMGTDETEEDIDPEWFLYVLVSTTNNGYYHINCDIKNEEEMLELVGEDEIVDI